jgi:hypothetical protein
VSLQEVDWRSELLEKYIAAHARYHELGGHEWKNVNQVWYEIENLPPEKKAESALTIADYLRQSVEENSKLYLDLSIAAENSSNSESLHRRLSWR